MLIIFTTLDGVGYNILNAFTFGIKKYFNLYILRFYRCMLKKMIFD